MNILKTLILTTLALVLTSCSSEQKRINPTNMAILMPITGNNHKFGQNLASMVELGLEDALEGNIKVMTYDIAEESRIPTVINKIKARGTKVILGPIFSATTQEIIPQIQTSGIVMITLSNNPALASSNASSNVFVMGHAPVKQTQRMIEYTLAQGYKDYIMLLPSSKYSRELGVIVGNMLTEKGAKLVQTELYTDKQESIELAIQNIVSTVQNINESEDSNMKPVLYISDDAPIIKEVANTIKKYNLDIQTLIVGDNKIDIRYDQPITFLFTGSISAHNDPLLEKARLSLGADYLTYFDLVAYDVGKIASHNLGQDLTPEQFVARLNSGHLYLGASGAIRFIGNVADRKYDIVKYESGSYSLVDEGR